MRRKKPKRTPPPNLPAPLFSSPRIVKVAGGWDYFDGKDHVSEFGGDGLFEGWFAGVVEEPPHHEARVFLRQALRTVPTHAIFSGAGEEKQAAISLRQAYKLLDRVSDEQVVICHVPAYDGCLRRFDICRQAGVIQTIAQPKDQVCSQGSWWASGA